MPFALLALIEAGICYASLPLATYIRFFEDGGLTYANETIGSIESRSLLVAVVFILVMLAMGLYQAQRRENIWNILNRVTTAYIVGSLVLSIIFYMYPVVYFGRGLFVLTLIISFLGIVFTRIVFVAWLDEHVLHKKVLVLGAGKKATWINRLRRKADRRGIKIVGYYQLDHEENCVEDELVVTTDRELDKYVLENGIEEVVVAVTDRRQNFPAAELMNCRLSGVDVVELPTFLERQMAKVYIELLDPSWIIFSNGFKQGAIKAIGVRALDLFASSLLLLVTSPLLILTALGIWLESGCKGSVFYKQIRVGQYNKPFELLKFRSMCENAEAGTGAQWATQNDSRVTRVGKIIRKYRIDELPQILNILKGQMSLVGPRPERPEFVGQLSSKIPFYSERHRVKPGLAGWAQMRYPYGSSENDAIEKLKFDLYYVKNSSLIFNIAILIQTAEIVLWGKGAR